MLSPNPHFRQNRPEMGHPPQGNSFPFGAHGHVLGLQRSFALLGLSPAERGHFAVKSAKEAVLPM